MSDELQSVEIGFRKEGHFVPACPKCEKPDLPAAVDKLRNTHSREKERIETFLRMVNEHHAVQEAALCRKDEALRAAKAFVLDCGCDCAYVESVCETCQLSALITAALEETNG